MKKLLRVGLYLLGLFIITIGINLSIISNLGVSPVSAFTYPLSMATNINLGTITTSTYTILVIIQVILLRKNFKLKNILQIPFSLAFGYFINLTGNMLSFIQPSNYIQQFIIMILGVIICAFGATLYIAMDIVPNAPEGFNLAVSEAFLMPFSKAKILSDFLFIGIGVVISLVFLGGIVALREGTIISALLTGKMIGVFQKYMNPVLENMIKENEVITLKEVQA